MEKVNPDFWIHLGRVVFSDHTAEVPFRERDYHWIMKWTGMNKETMDSHRHHRYQKNEKDRSADPAASPHPSLMPPHPLISGL